MVRRSEIDPADHDERLGEAIEEFLAQAEGGSIPDPDAFVARYPDLGDDLREALDGLALVQGLVGDPTQPPVHRLEAGRRLAGYRIVRELGRGGMGVVYEAVHVGLDRPVALKILGAHAAPDSNGRRRFLNEARTAAGLHHTHIVPVFDVGQVGGLCYYAMQRIEGSGLDRVVRVLRRDRSTGAGSSSGKTGASRTPPPPLPGSEADVTDTWVPHSVESVGRKGPPRLERFDESTPFNPPRGSAYYRWVAGIGREAAEALGHAHQRGIIHRDIKPSNLLVDARGSVWVADFGLARRLADPALTQADSLLGTPRYMSPEQAEIGPIDGRTDVYSLGATLYELLTLRPAYEGQTAAELIRQILGREPVPPRRFDPRIPRDLETIILKAMARRSADRYASADDLADDLGRFLGHEPVQARRISPIGRLWRLVRRHPGISAVTATAALAILATATVAYVRVRQERDEAIQARSDTRTALGAAEAANRKTRAALLKQSWREASVLRFSHVADRRERGLRLLKEANELDPDPAMRANLRDEAVEFLVIHDVVEDHHGIPAGKTQGLVFMGRGDRLATLADDGSGFDLWDLNRRERLAAHPMRLGPAAPTPGPSLGPNRSPRIVAAGSKVAVIWRDGQGIRLFDASTGAPRGSLSLELPGSEIVALHAAPGGESLVTIEHARPDHRASDRKDTYRINVWDPEHPDRPIATLDAPPRIDDGRRTPPPLPLVAVAPDGETIATARPGNPTVMLWSKDGSAIGAVATQAQLSALALGPDGLLAVAGDGEVRLWQIDSRTPTPLPGLSPHQGGWVTILRFSPDGTILALAGPGVGIELWDLAANSLVTALATPDKVNDLAFAPDGRKLAASGMGPTVRIWDVVDPVGRIQLPKFKTQVKSLAFGPEGLLAMISWDEELRLWRAGHGPTAIRASDPIRATAITFDAQGRLVALEPNRLRRFQPLDPRSSSGKGDALADLGEIRLPEPRDHGPKRKPPPPLPSPMSIARSANGRTLVLTRRGEVFVLRSERPDRLEAVPFPAPPAPNLGDPGRSKPAPPWSRWWRVLAVSPAGDRLYLNSSDDKVSAWALAGNQPSRLDWPLPDDVTCLALSPDGKTLALGERSGAVALVDTSRGVVWTPLPPLEDGTDLVTALAFAPDGRELAVGANDRVRIWKLGSQPTPVVALPSQRGMILALAYDADGRHLASGGADKVIEVWDLDRVRRELGKLGLAW